MAKAYEKHLLSLSKTSDDEAEDDDVLNQQHVAAGAEAQQALSATSIGDGAVAVSGCSPGNDAGAPDA